MKHLKTVLSGLSLAIIGSACADSTNAPNTIAHTGNHELDNQTTQGSLMTANQLAELRRSYPQYAAANIIIVDVGRQSLALYSANNNVLGTFPVSTASNGTGSMKNSGRTPLGAHRISQVFGAGAPVGAIFKARRNTGRIAKIFREPEDVKTDAVTTRVMWLDGLEPGKNKGGNVDSHQRYIYIHGTPEEGLIGQPASHGCIRMRNADVINLFEHAPVNTLVYIKE